MSERRYPLAERWNARLGRTEWVETHPDTCPRGHDWTRPGTVLPRHRPCGEHRRHREWRCATPGCDQVVVWPIGETRTPPADGPKF